MSESKKRFGADPATGNNLNDFGPGVLTDLKRVWSTFKSFRDVEPTPEQRAQRAAWAEEDRLHTIRMTKWKIRTRLAAPKLDPRRLP